MSHFPRQDRSLTRGYTLLELMIVLTLLAFLVAIVWPSLRRPLQRSTTQQAAQQLVADLARARYNAIETGRTMTVRYEPGGSRYWIVPADTSADGELSYDTSEGEDDSTTGGASDVLASELVIEGALEDGVVFQDPAAAELDSRLDSTLGVMLADEMAETEEVEPLIQDDSAEVGWSVPVLIYPTGRAENALFVLLGPEGYSVTVTLRGLTGAVTIGPLEHELRTVDERGTAEGSHDRLPEDDVTEPLDSLDR